jgi:hypothetical protein
MKITIAKIIRELEKKGWSNKTVFWDVIEIEVIKNRKGKTINGSFIKE